MASESEKILAKFNALHLAAQQLNHQCDAMSTFGQLEGVPEELIHLINIEVDKIVKSLLARANKLQGQYSFDLLNLIEESQL